MGIFDEIQLHFPGHLGTGDIVTFRGSLDCLICGVPMDQTDVDRGELLAMTARGEKPKAFIYHKDQMVSIPYAK